MAKGCGHRVTEVREFKFLKHYSNHAIPYKYISPVCMVKMMNEDVITQLVSPTSKSKMLGMLLLVVLVAPLSLLVPFAITEQKG
jgi:hypothetical protein